MVQILNEIFLIRHLCQGCKRKEKIIEFPMYNFKLEIILKVSIKDHRSLEIVCKPIICRPKKE